MSVAEFVLPWLNAAGSHFDIFGSLGLCLGFAAGTMPRRNLILLTAAAGSACFAMHFLRLGAYTGAAMCTLSLLQSLVSAFCLGSRKRSGFVAPVFALSSLAAASLTLASWNGWPSGCAAIGLFFSTCGRLQNDPQRMRLLFVGSSSFWAGHNCLIGSPFALTCDLLTISGLIIALWRAGSTRPAPLSPAMPESLPVH